MDWTWESQDLNAWPSVAQGTSSENASGMFNGDIVTEVVAFDVFYRAEDYHRFIFLLELSSYNNAHISFDKKRQ